MAITLTHTEIATLRTKLGLTARECADYLGIKSYRDIYNYEAEPARVKSAKAMSATHCTLLVMIADYHKHWGRLPNIEKIKNTLTEAYAGDISDGISRPMPADKKSTGRVDPDDLPSSREMRATYYKHKKNPPDEPDGS